MRFGGMKRTSLAQRALLAVSLAFAIISGCSEDDGSHVSQATADIYAFANGCYAVEGNTGFLARSASSSGYGFSASQLEGATPFFMKPSGLGTYLLFDEAAGYLTSDGTSLMREMELESDITTVDDTFQSEAEWELQAAPDDAAHFVLRHRKSGLYLAGDGVAAVAEATHLAFQAVSGCTEFPEESTYTEGKV